MAALRPLHYRIFERFLQQVGCRFVRQAGDHRVWARADLLRPIIVRAKKDLPVFEIKSNLRTLRMSTDEYLQLLDQR